MVHMVQQEPSLSSAEKTFFRLTCAGEGRVSSYWWHQGDAYLSSYHFISLNLTMIGIYFLRLTLVTFTAPVEKSLTKPTRDTVSSQTMEKLKILVKIFFINNGMKW